MSIIKSKGNEKLKSKYFYFFIPVLLLFLNSCCTYSFSGISTGIKSISIPIFDNESLKYGLEDTFTKAVTDAFIEDNRLKIVDEKTADAILFVTINTFERTPYSYDESENVKEYKIKITAKINLQESGTEEEVFKANNFSEWATYYPLTEVEEDGIDKVAKKFSEKILRSILESW
ncbi:LptE family protein [candidate division WOR-3 bacterium]|nr:LptE family protein [candidate division WOR-3 bacterium]